MAGYYRRFVEIFSQIAKPLTQLTRKDVPFVWTSKCEESFHKLRRRLTTAPVLALPSGSGGFLVHTDDSLQGFGSQLREWQRSVVPWVSLFDTRREQQGVRISSVLAEPALYTRIRESQAVDLKTQKLARLAQDGNTYGFHMHNNGMLCLSGRVVIPDDSTLREEIMSQDHLSRFSVHPGNMKMYKDLRTRNCDAIWVIADRLSKSVHFLPYNRDFTFDRMTRLYVQEVVRLHGIPLSIVSDKDPSYHRSIDMAPLEALYGRRCHMALFLDKVGERQVKGPQMIPQMIDAVEMIQYTKPKNDERKKHYEKKKEKKEGEHPERRRNKKY
ncbi:uncharacterized protein [Henckelia pumila]|uniref:uncharacterized protein n=1 Tax=Henckelia pumila TaxID=405737 RepID=UPI003C6E188B